MLYGEEDKARIQSTAPIFGSKEEGQAIPLYRLGEASMDPRIAYRLVKDELLDEGNARQNLATFCQTYMEDEAILLMSETLEKNAIDKSEYPKTAEIENRCVNIIADLWNAPKAEKYIGTSTIGSSESCMLAGMALKFSWRKRAEKLGLNVMAQKPNLIMSSGYQVCWEKFCVYWDIEMRVVPMEIDHMSLNIDQTMSLIDEYTIGIVGILGITYTGKFDDIAALDQRLTAYNNTTDYKVFIHVDAASGGLFTPFVNPELVWDFRLKTVISINASGHKYGLVYPGIGWVIWRDTSYLPEELVFNVSYLGGEVPTMAINFSHSASQLIGQYYNFLRLGVEGYRAIHRRTKDVALFISHEITNLGLFDIQNSGENLPIVCYSLKEGLDINWTLYELADRLAMKGWQVPTYPLPDNLGNCVIQRIVCRADLGFNMAQEFKDDFVEAIDYLQKVKLESPKEVKPRSQGFTH